MTLTISKQVPARTKTLAVLWCKPDFVEMSQDFRAARARFRNRMDKCF